MRKKSSGNSALARYLALKHSIRKGNAAPGGATKRALGSSAKVEKPDLLGAKSREKIITSLVDFAAGKKQSFRLAEKASFKFFCRGLNHSRQLPSRRALARAMSDENQEALVKLKKALADAPGKIALTADGWSSRAMNGHFAVTAHWIDKDWSFRSAALELTRFPPPRNQRALSALLIKILEDCDILPRARAIAADSSGAEMPEGENFVERRKDGSSSLDNARGAGAMPTSL
eukprot:Plantae.Rhodophyta-Hildenbrandia_rubra.ctg6406.p1 GENE.Plantae.Rhodophyta-Hildenbrandia_rubra.ctg6406~~Plantae.Rhodophyta-Hildenbrandia_rubra.ctg6406.p1  ORF type:complete len:232 (+),score=40.00 Plantae.Rhodophyta-Hildenbrandia_rubra.ctg6406:75-770(+)